MTEGVFQAIPATEVEMAQFTSGGTRFTLTLDGASITFEELTGSEQGSLLFRLWEQLVSFTTGSHTLIGTWTWDGSVIQRTTVTVRAG